MRSIKFWQLWYDLLNLWQAKSHCSRVLAQIGLSFQPSPSYPHQSPQSQQHQSKAFVASMPDNPITSTSSPWFLDSAVSDHITNDLHFLNPYQPYNRGDQVTIGNGSLLPIHNTGQGQSFQGYSS